MRHSLTPIQCRPQTLPDLSAKLVERRCENHSNRRSGRNAIGAPLTTRG